MVFLNGERSGSMRVPLYLSAALLAVGAFGGPASAANMCRAERLTCPTTMPVGGYCECTAHGTTEGGTVESKLAPRAPVNATAGGCGAHPGAPGCR
jgi:hypothetical protein